MRRGSLDAGTSAAQFNMVESGRNWKTENFIAQTTKTEFCRKVFLTFFPPIEFQVARFLVTTFLYIGKQNVTQFPSSKLYDKIGKTFSHLECSHKFVELGETIRRGGAPLPGGKWDEMEIFESKININTQFAFVGLIKMKFRHISATRNSRPLCKSFSLAHWRNPKSQRGREKWGMYTIKKKFSYSRRSRWTLVSLVIFTLKQQLKFLSRSLLTPFMLAHRVLSSIHSLYIPWGHCMPCGLVLNSPHCSDVAYQLSQVRIICALCKNYIIFGGCE
jgi:hypothetical protein